MNGTAQADHIKRDNRTPHPLYAVVVERTAPRCSCAVRSSVPHDLHDSGRFHDVSGQNDTSTSRTVVHGQHPAAGGVPAGNVRPEGWVTTALEAVSYALAANDWEYAEILLGRLKALCRARGRTTVDLIGFTQRKPALEATSEPLLEPLRARELEVLALVAEGQSNREIAEKLFVSVGTVRWHLKNIYSKLDVHSRTRAVARARATGLLN